MNATQETTVTLNDTAIILGLSIESSAPRGEVEPAQSKESKPWPHIAYDVTLKRNGKPIWSGPYKLGVGHVKTPKLFSCARFTSKEQALLQTWQNTPYAEFTDKKLHATVAAKLAAAQNVTPKLDDVLSSLLMDGSAYFDAQSFEEWCSDYGYDADSRKAEATWKACDEVGRNLARAFTPSELSDLREVASNH